MSTQDTASLADRFHRRSKRERVKAPRKARGVVRLSDEQRNAVLTLLSETPRKTDVKIAEAVGVHRTSVAKIRGELVDAEVQELDALNEAGKRIEHALPIRERVRLLRKLAKGQIPANQAFPLLGALKYADELAGIVTRKAQKEAEGQVTPGPMFVLPPGSQVMVVSRADMNTAKQLEEAKVQPLVMDVQAQVIVGPTLTDALPDNKDYVSFHEGAAQEQGEPADGLDKA